MPLESVGIGSKPSSWAARCWIIIIILVDFDSRLRTRNRGVGVDVADVAEVGA